MCCHLVFDTTCLGAEKICKIQQPKAKLDQCNLEMHSRLLLQGITSHGKREAALSVPSLQLLQISLYVR